jgi:probable F420-dependent oxidoreductase
VAGCLSFELIYIMLLDAAIPPVRLSAVPSIAQAAETMGFNALWSSETIHDPFLPGALISEHTKRLKFGTSIAVSFARSPTTMAYTAWDLAQMSQGRFILGLGTQVKAHIERRFGMPWPESPINKLRQQIGAMRTLWQTWQTGEKLRFQTEYYKLTLMSPFFNPGPIEHPEIPIFIAGVNTGMARLAGEVADGFLVHPFHSPRYLREVILPAIEGGAVNAGRPREDIAVSVSAFVITGADEREFARQQISFYASTPSYRPVMELYEWSEVAEELSSLASRKKWAEMPNLISDEMLAEFATIASQDDLPASLLNRYQDIADRITIYTPFVPSERDSFWRNLITEMS